MSDIVINRKTQQEKYFKTLYPDQYALIIRMNGRSWYEKLYMYLHGLDEPQRCKQCDQPSSFVGLWKGYNDFCCSSCANKYNASRSKKTKLERYGQAGWNNREAAKKTCLERYGTDSVMKVQPFRDKLPKQWTEQQRSRFETTIKTRSDEKKQEIQSKRSRTCIEKYGNANVMHLPEYQQKCKDSILKSNGTGIYRRINKLAIESIKQKTIDKYSEIIGYEGADWKCACPHPGCTVCAEKYYITSPQIHRDRIKWHAELCTRLLPAGRINSGTSIELFVREILDSRHIQHTDNSYSIISPKSLDIYIPSHRLAIECNGVRYHSTEFKSWREHYNKFKACEQQGIQLLTIWEDWIVRKSDIVRSLILSKLGIAERIGASKCKVVDIDSHTAADFLESNHIQGRCKSKVRLGLEYKGELVSLMCFNRRSKLSGSKKESDVDEWELIRFCNKIGYSVYAGASRLLAHFIRDYHPDRIVSFSSNDISDGKLYRKLGFQKASEQMSYWYVKNDSTHTRYHRSAFTKDNIIKLGWAPSTDKSEWTESEVMSQHPFFKIYDSGTTKWELEVYI